MKVIILIVILVVVLMLIHFKRIENFTDETTYTSEQVKNAIKNVKGQQGPRGLRGSTGPRGKEGPRGSAGGVLIDSGPLRNANPDYKYMVLDRRSGSSQLSYAYLAPEKYTQNQTWVLTSENKLQNRFGMNQCLTGNVITGDVYMNSCDTSNTWHHNQFGQLEMDNGNSKEKYCLGVQEKAILNGAPQIINHQTKGSRQQKNVYTAKLELCEQSSPSQTWSFY